MRDDIFSSRRRAEKQNAREKWTTATTMFTTGVGGSDSRWRSLRYVLIIDFDFFLSFLPREKKGCISPRNAICVFSRAVYAHIWK